MSYYPYMNGDGTIMSANQVNEKMERLQVKASALGYVITTKENKMATAKKTTTRRPAKKKAALEWTPELELVAILGDLRSDDVWFANTDEGIVYKIDWLDPESVNKDPFTGFPHDPYSCGYPVIYTEAQLEYLGVIWDAITEDEEECKEEIEWEQGDKISINGKTGIIVNLNRWEDDLATILMDNGDLVTFPIPVLQVLGTRK